MQQERVKYYKRYWAGKTGAEALAEYQALFVKQGGSCAVCNRHQSQVKQTLGVDHCHKTGTVRGLLCLECNLGLGKFKDSADLLDKASKYLKRQEN